MKDTLCYVVFKQAAGRVQFTLFCRRKGRTSNRTCLRKTYKIHFDTIVYISLDEENKGAVTLIVIVTMFARISRI